MVRLDHGTVRGKKSKSISAALQQSLCEAQPIDIKETDIIMDDQIKWRRLNQHVGTALVVFFRLLCISSF
jgi:hypothetical protein